jgi:hypothetical protein
MDDTKFQEILIKRGFLYKLIYKKIRSAHKNADLIFNLIIPFLD